MTLWSCREVSRMIGRGELEDAPVLARWLAWIHLLYCRHCRRYRRQMRLLAEAARLWAGWLLEAYRLEALERRLIERLSGQA